MAAETLLALWNDTPTRRAAPAERVAVFASA
jgi:hypothetical protein